MSRNTVDKLLNDVGAGCLAYQDEHLTNLPCKRIQCDEIWSFVYAKQKNIPEELRPIFGYGDVWTWTAICADTKLVLAWEVGPRDADAAKRFMDNLAGRMRYVPQLTTDGYRVYLEAVEGAFHADVDMPSL